MILRPSRADLQLIGYHLGRVLVGLAAVMLLPALVAVGRGEWNALTSLTIGASITALLGHRAQVRFRTHRPLRWTHGMVTVGAAWLVAAPLAAIPLYLGGHLGSYLDATFEAMSGLTTTGLTLTQDLDHLSVALNLYRHVLQLVGGQAFAVIVLTFLKVSSTSGGQTKKRDVRADRVLPNTSRSTRFIAQVAGTYLVLGTTALTVAGIAAGLRPGRALLHGFALFVSAYDTGAFTLQSTSANYYHSVAIESLLIVLMLAGALSYGLHYQLWRRNSGELVRNIEVRTMAATLGGLLLIAFIGLGRSGAFTDAGPMFRRGLFTLVSAHTTTGMTITDPAAMVADWGVILPAALVTAMAIGGMASSAAGGITGFRLGVTLKGVAGEVREVLLPESSLVVTSYHQHRRLLLRDEHVRAAATVLLLFLFTYLAGGIISLFYDPTLDFTDALFESTAATTTSGMSIGITSPSAAVPVKLVLLTQMWLGRLEFLAAFAAIGYVVALLRGRT